MHALAIAHARKVTSEMHDYVVLRELGHELTEGVGDERGVDREACCLHELVHGPLLLQATPERT